MKPMVFVIGVFIAFLILWQTNQVFWAVVVLILGEAYGLSLMLKRTKKGLQWIGRKVKAGAKKEWNEIEQAKPKAPNAGAAMGEYFSTAGKELGKAGAREEYRYQAPNLWARLGNASKNLLDGLGKWFKK